MMETFYDSSEAANLSFLVLITCLTWVYRILRLDNHFVALDIVLDIGQGLGCLARIENQVDIVSKCNLLMKLSYFLKFVNYSSVCDRLPVEEYCNVQSVHIKVEVEAEADFIDNMGGQAEYLCYFLLGD